MQTPLTPVNNTSLSPLHAPSTQYIFSCTELHFILQENSLGGRV